MDSSNVDAGLIGFFLTFYWIFIIGFYVLNGLAFMNLAKIAGRSDIAWMAWVPVCSAIQQLLLIKKSGWNVLWYLVPVANFVFMIIWQVKLLGAYGKNGAFVLFNLFIPIVYSILWVVWGFSKETQYTLPTGPKSSRIPA
jgi:uncharacterized membrane protein YhaH (DUF805 family)